MSGRHEQARLLLPWLANGSLGEAERAAVEAHLERCADCRAELELCRALADDSRSAEELAPAPHPVQLERLLERVAAGVESPEPAPAPPARSRRPWPRAARWTVAAQAAALLLVALGALAVPRAGGPGFRTLSDPAPETPPAAGLRLRVVFEPELTEVRLRELLGAIGGEIVAGPTPLGVYTIAVRASGGEPDGWRIEHLRAQPGVRFVEASP